MNYGEFDIHKIYDWTLINNLLHSVGEENKIRKTQTVLSIICLIPFEFLIPFECRENLRFEIGSLPSSGKSNVTFADDICIDAKQWAHQWKYPCLYQ